MALFCGGTLMCALAPGFTLLLAGRVVQASGTAIMVPLLMTSILTLVPAGRRGQVMGTMTVVQAVAPAVGPAAAGAVLTVLDWRWMFWLVLPVGGTVLIVGMRWLRVEATTTRVRLDVASVLLTGGAFSTLVYGITRLAEPGPAHSAATGEVPAWGWVMTGTLLLTIFVRRQVRLRRRGSPLSLCQPAGRSGQSGCGVA